MMKKNTGKHRRNKKMNMVNLRHEFETGFNEPCEFEKESLNEASKRSLEIVSAGLKIVDIIACCTCSNYYQHIFCVMFNEETKEFIIAKASVPIYDSTQNFTYWDGLFDDWFSMGIFKTLDYQLSIEHAETCEPKVYIPRMFEINDL